MKDAVDSCHGTFRCLRSGSAYRVVGPILQIHQKVRSYVVWWIENLGWRGAMKQALVRIIAPKSETAGSALVSSGQAEPSAAEEVLRLRPGELVEVRPIEEILATLDQKRKCKGLLWMTGMRKHCGKRYRVYKRVDRIVLETDGQMRRMKNTVLLEGVMCDGSEFGGCDRSCFHFWRELWLRRVAEG